MFEAYKERYKNMESKHRLMIVSALAFVVAGYMQWNRFDKELIRFEEVKGRLATAEIKRDEAYKKKSTLEKLDKERSAAQQKIADVSRSLPVEFMIDDVLRETASVARQAGVEMRVFKPGKPADKKPTDRYEELPIEINVRGSFPNVTMFFDRVLHFTKLVHLRNISLKRTATTGGNDLTQISSRAERIRLAKERVFVDAAAQLIIFRGLP